MSGRRDRKRTAAPPSSAGQQRDRRRTAIQGPGSGRRQTQQPPASRQQNRPRTGTAEQIRQPPRPRPPSGGGGHGGGRGPNQNQPNTVEDRQAADDNSPEFLEQLRAWANRTSGRELAELEREFAQLQAIPRPPASSEFTRYADLNRYRDVICVDNNRVQLANGRYIHANWIDSQGERRFICTQGPLASTVDDFWQMVVQEKIEAVVMLCNTVELGRPKCHQYWPTEESPSYTSTDGSTRVLYINKEKPDPGSELYKTRLNVFISGNQNKPHQVRHFHWRNWPDRGVPRNHLAALRLLHFIQPYNKIVVHCSAGIGRTGTVVAIYMAQNRMRANQPLDLYELVQQLRAQRAQSVQSLDQYLYIYSVLLRYAKNKADRGRIQLNTEGVERLIQAIQRRLFPGTPNG